MIEKATYPKALHRHASGYVEREGPGAGLRKHEHADGTVHDDHAVAPNEYNNPEPDGWEEPTIAHFRPSKETADLAEGGFAVRPFIRFLERHEIGE